MTPREKDYLIEFITQDYIETENRVNDMMAKANRSVEGV